MRSFEAKWLYAGLVTLTVWLLLEALLALVRSFFAPEFSPFEARVDGAWGWLVVLALGCHAARRAFCDRVPSGRAGTSEGYEPSTRALRDGVLAFTGIVFVVWGITEALTRRAGLYADHPLYAVVSAAGHVLCGIALLLWPALGREFEDAP